MMNADNDKDDSVEDLLKKLAKKGKKVKLIDETASVKELPAQENNDIQDDHADFDRDRSDKINDSIDEINEEAAPSSVKKKIKKIKDERKDSDDLDPNEQLDHD